MANSCINLNSPEYKHLLDNSGLSEYELTYVIYQWRELYNNPEGLPSLEQVLNLPNIAYDIRVDKDFVINTIFENTLHPKNRKEETYEITQSNLRNIMDRMGYLENSNTEEFIQYLNTSYPFTKVSRLGTYMKGNVPYTLLKIVNLATQNKNKETVETIDRFDLLSSLGADEDYKTIIGEPVYVLGDYNIIQKRDSKYTVFKGNPNSYAELNKNKSYNTFEDALKEANRQFSQTNSLNNYLFKDIVSNSNLLYKVFNANEDNIILKGYNRKLNLNSLDIYNIQLPEYTLDSSITQPLQYRDGRVSLKTDISREEVFNSIEGRNEREKYIYSQLVRNGYDITTIRGLLNSDSKLTTFLLLKAQYYQNNQEAFERLSRIPNIKASSVIDINASLYALNYLADNESTTFNVVFEQTLDGNQVVLSKNKQNNSLSNIRTDKPFNEQTNMVYLLSKLSEDYGFRYDLITNYELKRDPKFSSITNAESRKAFILDGVVYINTDTATLSEPIHELTHLIMGSLKQKKPFLYNELLRKVYEIPDYDNRVRRYLDLTESDRNEEIFTEVFSDYLSGTLVNENVSSWFLLNNGLFDTASYESKRIIDELIDPTESTTNEISSKLFNMSLNDVMDEFGTALRLGKFSEVIDNDLARTTRKMANLKNRLIKDNKLKETCY